MLIKRLDRRFDRSCSERLAERAGPFNISPQRYGLSAALVMLMFTPATISTGQPTNATADRIRTDRHVKRAKELGVNVPPTVIARG
jgi:hypothetical protein